MSLWFRVEISPLASFIGGPAPQEILKYTENFSPIYQWVWFDFRETVSV